MTMMKCTKVHNARHWLTACTACKLILIMGMFRNFSARSELVVHAVYQAETRSFHSNTYVEI